MSFGISVGDILKLCEVAGRVYKNCRDCTGDYKSLVSEARSLTNILGDIADKYDKIPDAKREQFVDAYEPCLEVLDELDKILVHYNGLDTKSKRAWDRLKYDPDRIRTLRARLSSSVVMLNTFYTGLIHDSQVLILEALERLENDYKGGHREESIASLERITSEATLDNDDTEDAAWTQILRDLEDVGVSQQEAISYRDFIVDWLVSAVNEGRLLEQRPEEESFASMTRDLRSALPLHHCEPVQIYRLEVPAVMPPVERSRSVPSAAGIPVPDHTPQLIPQISQRTSTVSLPVSVPSAKSIDLAGTSDADATSLSNSTRLPQGQRSSFQIKRVPVPRRELYEEEVAPMLPFMPPEVISTVNPPYEYESTLEAIQPTLIPTPSTWEPPPPPPPPLPAIPSSEPVVCPPGYYEREVSVTADLDWTAHQIVAAWSRRDFAAAERLLEDQLTAVERGYTLASGVQPDRRILRHLLGVCASFLGNFIKAKRLFESVFNGIFLNRGNLDEGDIAAARWLGDACLHLREHHNALLAYSVAYEGSLGRFGIARDVTSRVSAELKLLDHWLYAFARVEHSFQLNVDPTDIFASTHAVEKSNLLITVKARLYDNTYMGASNGPPINQYAAPSMQLGARPKMDLGLAEGFLTGPLISLSKWPFPWDPTFSPVDSVQLDRYMNCMRITRFISPLVERSIPSVSLGDSKKLHYVTKKGSHWLIETVKQGLRDLGVEHAEHPFAAAIVCTLNQQGNGFTFSQGVEIGFRKLQFRNIFGIKVSDVKWATRRFLPAMSTATPDFRDLIKGILQTADMESDIVLPANNQRLDSSTIKMSAPELVPSQKRPMYG